MGRAWLLLAGATAGPGSAPVRRLVFICPAPARRGLVSTMILGGPLLNDAAPRVAEASSKHGQARFEVIHDTNDAVCIRATRKRSDRIRNGVRVQQLPRSTTIQWQGVSGLQSVEHRG